MESKSKNHSISGASHQVKVGVAVKSHKPLIPPHIGSLGHQSQSPPANLGTQPSLQVDELFYHSPLILKTAALFHLVGI